MKATTTAHRPASRRGPGRKRINMTVSPDMYNALCIISREAGFDKVTELMTTLATVLLRQCHRQREQHVERHHDETDADYISAMFRELETGEPCVEDMAELGGSYVRHNNTVTLETVNRLSR